MGIEASYAHAEKAEIAAKLYEDHGLPDVSGLLIDLNAARKGAAYGDIEGPDLDPGDVATEIEEFVEAVAKVIEGTQS